MNKKKKLIFLLLTLSILPGCMQKPLNNTTPTYENKTDSLDSSHPYEFISNGDGSCYIYGNYEDNIEEITFPETSPLGEKVISIVNFANKTKLKRISFPRSIKAIGDSAFLNCRNLEKVSFKSGVEEIESHAFEGCLSIKEISFPNTLRIIGEYSFSGCSSLKTINCPDSLEEIKNHAFNGCSSLMNPTFNTGLRLLGGFENCSSISSLKIPSNVKRISNGCFINCTSLTEITIEDGIEEIFSYAFESCAISTVFIPKSVSYMGSYVFNGCPEDLEIHCETPTQPLAWDELWNGNNRTVYWGCTRDVSNMK